MQHNVAFLYAHIFLFLGQAARWYTDKSRKRLFNSLKEDFWNRFEKDISNIKHISLLISREAQHASHAEIRYVRFYFEKSNEDSIIRFHGLERELAESRMQAAKDQRELRELVLNRDQRMRSLELLVGGLGEMFLKQSNVKRLPETHRAPNDTIYTPGTFTSFTEYRSLMRYSRVSKQGHEGDRGRPREFRARTRQVELSHRRTFD